MKMRKSYDHLNFKILGGELVTNIHYLSWTLHGLLIPNLNIYNFLILLLHHNTAIVMISNVRPIYNRACIIQFISLAPF